MDNSEKGWYNHGITPVIHQESRFSHGPSKYLPVARPVPPGASGGPPGPKTAKPAPPPASAVGEVQGRSSGKREIPCTLGRMENHLFE